MRWVIRFSNGRKDHHESRHGSDILGRIGGDEFMVFMKDITEEKAGGRKAEELKENFWRLIFRN